MSERDNYSEAIRDLENTLNGYNEKETRKIIMEFLRKHEEDYRNKRSQDEKSDEEYEVYSNSFAGFNDDYIPEEYEESDGYNEYDDEEDYGGYEDDADNVKETDNSGEDVVPNVVKKRDGAKRTQKRRKVYDNGYFDENANVKEEKSEKADKKSNNSGTAPIIAKISCVMVVILAVVVIFLFNRLNEADARIAKLSLGEAKTQEYESTIEDLQTQLGNRDAHIENLNSQIEAYKSAFDDTDTSEDETEGTSNADKKEDDKHVSEPSDSESKKPKTYTVVKGDNLSKISKRNYGSEKYVDLIKEANNITDDVLSIGDTLIIPEV